MAKEKTPEENTEVPVEESTEEGSSEENKDEKSSDETTDEEPTVTVKRPEFDELHQNFIFKKVDSIKFGLLSPKHIKKMASAKIVTPELYDKEGYPVDGGLMDIRLGVIDPGLRCRTCGSKLKECIGHFGYIELARSVIHIKFVPVILNLLRGTCNSCGRVLIPNEKIDKIKKSLDRIEAEEGLDVRRLELRAILTSLKTISKCPHCKAKQAKISLEKPSTFIEEDKRLSSIEVRARLEKIEDEDLQVFGINAQSARPEWMVLTILAIPPVTMRPSITLESGERSEDDLTHKMGDIVRINQRLFENINAGAPEIIIEDLWELLQYHVTTFFDNNVAQLPPARHRNGQPLKTILERIKSKEGRIRHNLAGKRTNFCARSVISPDPMLSINEVGVPKVIAMKVTVPEVIQEWNYAYLKKFVERGPKEYPGSNYVVRPDGKRKKITDETKEALLEEIQPGYVVERHMMDGDVALFNRQPSLHRMSMMCHRVRVLPGKTMRLNPAVCAPYNADFDGDEMNLHVPQTEEARAEAEILMDVQTQIVSPRYGLSIIGANQDFISGNYVLTKDLEFSRQDTSNLLMQIGLTDFKLPSKDMISGKEIFSMLLPPNFNFVGQTKAGDKFVIKNGKLTEGVVDSANIGGEGAGLMLRSLHAHFGSQVTIDILHNIMKLGAEVLIKRGFTTSVADSDLNEGIQKQITDTLDTAESDAQKIIDSYHDKSMEIFPGRTAEETRELKILEILNRSRNVCGKIVKDNVDKTTHTMIMANSGARGNILNLAMMAAVVGQQALRGSRITKGYEERTLSCFKRNDLSPEAHGFIRNSFKSGLSPKEFYFGAITGRDALMDTALRTPKSGYLYRRLSNAMQDVRVEYDGTVRDSSGKIIQFVYGEDGLDVSRTDHGKIQIKKIIEEA